MGLCPNYQLQFYVEFIQFCFNPYVDQNKQEGFPFMTVVIFKHGPKPYFYIKISWTRLFLNFLAKNRF